MKKMITMLTLLLVCIMGVSINIIADETPVFRVSEAYAGPNDEVELTISIEHNPGIAAFSLMVSYDPNVLEWVSASQGSLSGLWDIGVDQNEVWIDSENHYEDAVAVFLRFKVRDSAREGKSEVSVSYQNEDVFDEFENNIFFEVVPGGITITESQEHTSEAGPFNWTTDESNEVHREGFIYLDDPQQDETVESTEHENSVEEVPEKMPEEQQSGEEEPFDLNQNVISKVVIPDQLRTVEYYYNEKGQETAEYVYENDELVLIKNREFDQSGNVTRETQKSWKEDGTETTVITEYRYHEDGFVEANCTDGEGKETTKKLQYDFNGNCLLEEYSTNDGHVERYLREYDDKDHVLLEVFSQDNKIVEMTFYEYNYEGDVIISAQYADNKNFENPVIMEYGYEPAVDLIIQ